MTAETSDEGSKPQTISKRHEAAIKASKTRRLKKQREVLQKIGAREAERRREATRRVAPQLKRWSRLAPPDTCVVCYEDNESALQNHHLLPDDPEVVKLCGSCHNLINTLKKGETASHLIAKFVEIHNKVSEKEVLENKRLKWFRKLRNEAYYKYEFKGLSEMLEWMKKRADKV